MYSVKTRGENLNNSPTENNLIFSETNTKSEWQHPNLQNSKSKSKSFNKVFLKLTLIPIIVLSIFAFFSFDNESWVVTGLDHFYFEMISVILSFLVAFYCIMRGYVLKDKLSLFLGLVFNVAFPYTPVGNCIPYSRVKGIRMISRFENAMVLSHELLSGIF